MDLWMGGMDGLRVLLQRILNPSGQRFTDLKLDQYLRLMPVPARVLTSQGPLVAYLDDAQDYFGGDVPTQMIRTTIYAPNHEYNELTAVCLLCHCLLTQFFGEVRPLLDIFSRSAHGGCDFAKDFK